MNVRKIITYSLAGAGIIGAGAYLVNRIRNKRVGLGILGGTGLIILATTLPGVMTNHYFPYKTKTADNTYNVEIKKIETQTDIQKQALLYGWKRDSINVVHNEDIGKLDAKVNDVGRKCNSLNYRVGALELLTDAKH